MIHVVLFVLEVFVHGSSFKVVMMVSVTVVSILMLVAMMRFQVEVSACVRMSLRIRHMQSSVMHVFVLHTVASVSLDVVEQVVVLVLNTPFKGYSTVVIDIVVVIVVGSSKIEAMVKLILLWLVTVSVVMFPVSLVLLLPIIWHVLNSVVIVVLVTVLRVVLHFVIVRVVVTHVMVSLWLDVVVLSVLLSSEVSFVAEMRDMVLQFPVALREVSLWMVLVAVDKLAHVRGVMCMVVLVRSQLVWGHAVQQRVSLLLWELLWRSRSLSRLLLRSLLLLFLCLSLWLLVLLLLMMEVRILTMMVVSGVTIWIISVLSVSLMRVGVAMRGRIIT